MKLSHNGAGGDCKTLMFVQISPSSADLGETICSLNFASRVRGVEHGPARKQTDTSELFKYKQLVIHIQNTPQIAITITDYSVPVKFCSFFIFTCFIK